jgi:hypothetical protein
MVVHYRISSGLAAAIALGLAIPAPAQVPPADLTTVPPVPTTYVPARTPWGDPDLRGTWPTDHVNDADIPIVRDEKYGTHAWLTQEQYDERLAKAKESDAKYSAELRDNGTKGLADWLAATELGHRTSLLVDPPNGRIPALTPAAEARHKAGRASWVKEQPLDWLDDFDNWDRCVTPGFPAAMLSYPYDNAVRLFQAPGYVVINQALLGARIVPLGKQGAWPDAVRASMGSSRGHWEGNTLVIETANLVAGDGASHDLAKRAMSPVYWEDPQPMPVGPHATAVERLTMVGPDRIIYQVTYSDPDTFTAPWTARIDWQRDESYQIFEFACHEGNVQLRDMINASRAQRKADAAAGREAGK